MEEADGPLLINGGRGPYERAWTTEATRALIHIRGPMEGRFTEGRQKRTALWLQCTRQLQKLGFRYSAAKVQKKWHNILITYNKNLGKKYLAGYVHWEFFEEMFKYLQGKKADCEIRPLDIEPRPKPRQSQKLQQVQQQQPTHQENENCQQFYNTNQEMMQSQVQVDVKIGGDYENDRVSMAELKKPKLEYNAPLPLEISHANGFEQNTESSNMKAHTDSPFNEYLDLHSQDSHSAWWKDYFERKLQVEREKIQLQKDMHRDLMTFNRTTLMQNEKIERVKIDAINNLTNTLQKYMETKNRKM